MTYSNDKYSGFTLIEILLVVGLLSIIALTVITAVNPQKLFSDTRNVDRWNSIQAFQSGLEQWVVDGHSLLDLKQGDGSEIVSCDVGSNNIMVSYTSNPGEVDLYTELVEGSDTYLAMIPMDPLVDDYDSDSGYDVCLRMSTSRVSLLVFAPLAEADEWIATPVSNVGDEDTVAERPPAAPGNDTNDEVGTDMNTEITPSNPQPSDTVKTSDSTDNTTNTTSSLPDHDQSIEPDTQTNTTPQKDNVGVYHSALNTVFEWTTDFSWAAILIPVLMVFCILLLVRYLKS